MYICFSKKYNNRILIKNRFSRSTLLVNEFSNLLYLMISVKRSGNFDNYDMFWIYRKPMLTFGLKMSIQSNHSSNHQKALTAIFKSQCFFHQPHWGTMKLLYPAGDSDETWHFQEFSQLAQNLVRFSNNFKVQMALKLLSGPIRLGLNLGLALQARWILNGSSYFHQCSALFLTCELKLNPELSWSCNVKKY